MNYRLRSKNIRLYLLKTTTTTTVLQLHAIQTRLDTIDIPPQPIFGDCYVFFHTGASSLILFQIDQ